MMGDVGVRKMEEHHDVLGHGHGQPQAHDFMYGRRPGSAYGNMGGGPGSAASMGMGVGIRHAGMGGVLGSG